MDEALIPGLPDDLALHCLSKVSHGFHGVLECVSKRWRDVIRSSEYEAYKSRKGWCGDWLFVLTEGHENQWAAYDPEADRWHPVPRMPMWKRGPHIQFSCASVSNQFFVIGGMYAALRMSVGHLPSVTNQVFCFDPFRKQWSEVASMKTPRSGFACSVICGKVYVGGGSNSSSPGGLLSAEVYDPVENRWDDLPAMPNPRADCFGVSYNSKFWILSDKSNLNEVRTMDIFDPGDGCWCSVKDVWQESKKFQNRIVVVDDRLYTLVDWGANSVHTRRTETECWNRIGSLPAIIIPKHPRSVESFGHTICGLRHELYAIGGKTIKLEEAVPKRFEIVKLNTMWVCNPSSTPLQWRETRPYLGLADGSLVGCGSLEEHLPLSNISNQYVMSYVIYYVIA